MYLLFTPKHFCKLALAVSLLLFATFTTQAQLKLRSAKPLTKQGIMQALYQGNYDIKTNSSKFICNEPDVLNKFSLTSPMPFTSKILYADSLVTIDGKMLYVLLSLNPDDDMLRCMACSPAFKFIVLNKTSNVWAEVSENITDGIGQMGEAGNFEVKTIGKNIGFVFGGAGLNMGELEESMILYTYYNNNFKQIAHITGMSYTNQGNCNPKKPNSCYSYNGKIQFLNTGKDFNDILVTKKGTDLRKGRVIKIDSAITYKFVNGQYVR
ncbi:hypothetical protein [Mucilaginibacter jinjuensis]|uniref:Uncharacterized protein n=1 Tax=Mucilaginibacter jinjuensis TaxID=1176721 RepID=A0ABY7T2X3_9SPHI|nr:hypothetical protein [Mucilaginibacter jinjuensis]WCT10148.1 hypothetical protein PQO05_15545 [Mucilaginibacter jinjuensis]